MRALNRYCLLGVAGSFSIARPVAILLPESPLFRGWLIYPVIGPINDRCHESGNVELVAVLVEEKKLVPLHCSILESVPRFMALRMQKGEKVAAAFLTWMIECAPAPRMCAAALAFLDSFLAQEFDASLFACCWAVHPLTPAT